MYILAFLFLLFLIILGIVLTIALLLWLSSMIAIFPFFIFGAAILLIYLAKY